MRTEIYRYGRYINAVDSQEELHTWLKNNLPYEQGFGIIPETMPLENCLAIAKNCGYVMKSDSMVARIERVLEAVNIKEVAEKLQIETVERGNFLIFDCPCCGGVHTACMNPKNQTYKCYKCNDAGNVVHFVMNIKNCTISQALYWLERTFINKK